MTTISVNCLHAICPNCGDQVDVIPAEGTYVNQSEIEEAFRCFLRTNHLTAEWDRFFAEYEPDKQ